MHGSAAQVREHLRALDAACGQLDARIIPVLALPFLYLYIAKAACAQASRIRFAAQDVSAHREGAFTGEVSAAMLSDIGVEYAIIGHSERRRYHGESDALIAQKAAQLQHAGVKAIACVGETLEEYQAGHTQAVLAQQLSTLIPALTAACVVAYEPVWAIGTGKTPRCDEIEAATAFLTTQLKEALDHSPAVVYGGSVNRSNAREILGTPGVAGALVGGASLNIDEMQTILHSAQTLAPKG